jgi:hypothetical protein
MTTQQIIEKVRQDISEQQIRDEEAKLPIDTTEAKWKVKDWKLRYCKGNQPRNNIRITRIIPIVAGAMPPPSFWVQKLQLWIKGELFYEYNIGHETYDTLFAHPDFNHQPTGSIGQMEYRIYRHPKFR